MKSWRIMKSEKEKINGHENVFTMDKEKMI